MLADAVKGALRPSQQITWTDGDGNAVNLTGATLTGKIRNISTGASRSIAGSLVLVTPASGIFRWDYASADLVDAGRFEVQFSAAFGTGATPAKTLVEAWFIHDTI